MDSDEEKQVVSPESGNKISAVIFFAACVHGFAAASIKSSPQTWVTIFIGSLSYVMGCLITGFLVNRYTSRQVSLIATFLMKACLIFATGSSLNSEPWLMVSLSISSLLSACIDVTMTAWILNLWQDHTMDTLLWTSASYSAGFVISYFCPMGRGFFSLDKIAASLMILVSLTVAILWRQVTLQHTKRRVKDGKVQPGAESDDVVVVRVIKPFSNIVILIAMSCIIIFLIRILWFNTILILKYFYFEIGFSVHLPLAEVTLRLLMTSTVTVFILVSRIGEFSRKILVHISLCLILIGTLFLIVTERNPSLMWAALAFLGFGFSSIIPLLFCVLERVINVTDRVTGILMAVIGLSDLVKLNAQANSFSRHLYSCANIAVATVAIILFISMSYAESKFTSRSKRRPRD